MLTSWKTGPAQAPGEIMNMGPYSLQTPFSEDSSIKIISHPELQAFQNLQLFYTSGSSVVLLCYAGGMHTPHSWFPRTELAQNHKWDLNGSTVHSMTLIGATERLTPVRPQVVIAQIFGSHGYLFEVRLNGTSSGVHIVAQSNPAQMTTSSKKQSLFLDERNSVQQVATLHSNYVLGTPYSIRLTGGNGVINVYYGFGETVPTASYTMTNPSTASYFKAGNYLQSNNVTFKELGTATSKVVIYSLNLSQSKYP